VVNTQDNAALVAAQGHLLGFKKADVVYHSVRRSILLGQLKPAELLLEQKIAEQLNCSQGTVREALMRLEQDGLVDRRGYSGTIVIQPSMHEAAEMARIRIQIECLGIRQSVGSFKQESITQLLHITEKMDQASQDKDFYLASELDRDFHMTTFRQSGFPALEPILNRCALHIHRITFSHADEARRDKHIGAEHRVLLSIFENRDPDQSETALRDHIESILDRFAPSLRNF
jgi:DNA-binding GntR family transcriptional regulator